MRLQLILFFLSPEMEEALVAGLLMTFRFSTAMHVYMCLSAALVLL